MNNRIVYDSSARWPDIEPSVNLWDSGYPSGGNYWSDYNGSDADGDGIGDAPYVICEGTQDHFPLMDPYGIPVVPRGPGDVNCDYKVDIYDIVAAAAAYDSDQSCPNWNQHADCASPFGMIDLYDIVTVAFNYGEIYPKP